MWRHYTPADRRADWENKNPERTPTLSWMINSVGDVLSGPDRDRLKAEAKEMNAVVHRSVGSSKNGELDELAITFLEGALRLIANVPRR